MGGFIAPVDTLSPPPSPPRSPTAAHAPDASSPAISKPRKPSEDLSQAIQSLPIEADNPLFSIVQLLKSQMVAQAQQQEQLLAQLGELRTSQALLKAQLADDQDEMSVLREKTAALSDQLEEERKRREESEGALNSEKEKVVTLRAKTEESRRAIMRLQDEAASRKNAESRRSSASAIVGLGQFSSEPSTAVPSRRASAQLGVAGRRQSLISGMEAPTPGSVSVGEPSVRRASLATSADIRRASYSGHVDTRRSSLTTERRASALANLSNSSFAMPGPPPAAAAAAASIGLGVDLAPLATSASAPQISAQTNQPKASEEPADAARPPLRPMMLNTEVSEADSNGRTRTSLTNIDEEGLGHSGQSKQHARRKSGRQSLDLNSTGSFVHPRRQSSLAQEQEGQAELALVKAELEAMREKLNRTEEAKQASEEVVKALKDFIAVPSAGLEDIKLPPLPTDDIPDEDEEPKSQKGGGYWTFPSLVTSSRKTAASADKKATAVSVTQVTVSSKQPLSVKVATSISNNVSSPALTSFSGWSRRRASTVTPQADAATPQNRHHNSAHGAETSVRPTPMNHCSVPGARFDTFSFASVNRNPALLDTPPSPGGSSFASPAQPSSSVF